jgi:aminoglycoside phosphotransferase (APT) family kinase protein
MMDHSGAVSVREGEHLDWLQLDEYIRQHLEVAGEIDILQFPDGGANLTYLVSYGDTRLVVRRPPFGELAPGAHDMRREYRVLSKLWQRYPRAPRGLLFCDDASVVGSDFLVVEYRHGVVVRDHLPSSLATSSQASRDIGFAVVEALADLHRVDPNACGLADLGRPIGFVERQVTNWLKRWRLVATEDIDEQMVHVGEGLLKTLPQSPKPSLLHNDFKTDNCQFRSGDPTTVASVFDWDMATLGDPLVDLGILLNYWPDPSDSADDHSCFAEGVDTLGLPTRAEVVEAYENRIGATIDHVRWYEAFACWKTIIVREQLHHRFLRGESADLRTSRLHEDSPMLARRAQRILSSR